MGGKERVLSECKRGGGGTAKWKCINKNGGDFSYKISQWLTGRFGKVNFFRKESDFSESYNLFNNTVSVDLRNFI